MECPANQLSVWSCREARALFDALRRAQYAEKTTPLFAEAGAARAAEEAYNAHMLDGHPDAESIDHEISVSVCHCGDRGYNHHEGRGACQVCPTCTKMRPSGRTAHL